MIYSLITRLCLPISRILLGKGRLPGHMRCRNLFGGTPRNVCVLESKSIRDDAGVFARISWRLFYGGPLASVNSKTIGLLALLWLPAVPCEAHTLQWTAPTTFPDGTALSGSEVTGYKIYVKTMGVWGLSSSESSATLSKTVADGTWAVAATYSGGQTGLSDSVTFPLWNASLAAPVAGNTVSNADSQATIQAKLDALTPGGVLYFRGGTYSYTSAGAYLTLGADGNAGAKIYVVNYPGEVPVLEGIGWASEVTGPAAATDQVLISITGDYNYVRGFTMTHSGFLALNIIGNHNYVRECELSHNWYGGCFVGDGAASTVDVLDNTMEYCSEHHSRVGGGIGIITDNETGDVYNVDGVTLRRCLMYRNGYNADDALNVFGGGNSDGTGVDKNAHDSYAFSIIDGNVTGRWNRVHDFHVLRCMMFLNADDGMDTSSGQGTLVSGSMSIYNGYWGVNGYKMLRSVFEDSVYQGNASIGRIGTLVPADKLMITAGSGAAIVATDVITGLTSGATATVVSRTMFTNGNASQTWTNNFAGLLVLSGVTGTFALGENIQVGGVTLATVRSFGQLIGRAGRIYSSGGAFPNGRNDEVGWTSLFHDPTPGSGGGKGVSSETTAARGGNFMNILSYYNEGADGAFGGFTLTTNHLNNAGVVPGIENTSYDFGTTTPTLTGATFEAKWRNLYRSVAGQIMANSGGNLYDAGTLNTTYYHATAADDPDTPSDPDDDTKLSWFESGKTTPTPDIGASQYQYIYPPVLAIGEAAAGGSTLNATTVNATNLIVGP